MEITTETVRKFNQLLFESDVNEALGGDSSMRTIFDSLCAEWEATTLDQKVNAFHVFRRHGYSVDDLVLMFQARFAKSVKYEYIMQDMPMAIELLYSHAVAVGDDYVSEGLKSYRSLHQQIAERLGPIAPETNPNWKPKRFL